MKGRLDRRLLVAMLVPGAALAAWLAIGGLLLWATLDPAERSAVAGALGPLVASHGGIEVAWWAAAAALAAWGVARLHAAHVAAPARLAAATQVLAGDPAAPDLRTPGALAAAINALASERRALHAQMARRVAEASEGVAQQRDQLGALMAELHQSVLVCNLDGRILLYNEHARRLFRRRAGQGTEPIGLGRSVYAVLDRAKIAQARATVEQRLTRGADLEAIPAQFETRTPGGHMLSVSLAPVRSGGPALTGFVLLLDDITASTEAQARRDRQLIDLTAGARASLASLQAALRGLDQRDLAAEARDRLLRRAEDAASAVGDRLADLDLSVKEPLTRPQEGQGSDTADFGEAPREGRPEYYDFDLFAASEGSHDLDQRPLAEIAYTVFDTETTGLDPGGGDEILQIGATRIVAGKLLRGEVFDQLVDPQRSIPEAGIAVHGIRPEMVRGKPTFAEVLPAFHGFCSDTVLVGHNVAFDMRFLALKEAASGAIFDQPVLDTLLLSSIVHPGEDSHGLEAIAGRLGVTLSGRHTALGDALATAEIFLRLLPLLRQQGILTLGQARAAERKSYYARLKY